MAIIQYHKNRAARKNTSRVDRSGVYKGKPWKSLTYGKKALSGRGSAGKITVRHRGGGVKKNWREIDFRSDKISVPARVERIEYDPNRTAWVALLIYQDGERRYVLAWSGAKAGDKVVADEAAPEVPGNRLRLKNVTPGATVYNIELKPERGGILQRSAGAFATVMDIQEKYALLKMPSTEIRMVAKDCWANWGAVGNSDQRLVRIGSAGRNRRLGKRPEVRGKVMNPVDHPHGGGEGLQPIGLKAPKTKWGKLALGKKTRRKKKWSNAMILSRRKMKGRKK